MKKLTLAAAAATTLMLTTAGCSFSDASATKGAATTDGSLPATIVLGAIPAENSTDLNESYSPLVKMIEAETGSKVQLQQASDYAGVIEGLIAGSVDIAFLGSFGYVIATENKAEITPIGAVTKKKGEVPGYYSLGLTQGSNTAINGLKDFAGKNVCFVDPGSTSGFLYPSSGLISEKVITDGTEASLSKSLKPVFAGGHDASALAIAKGDCDAGFAMESMVKTTLPAKGELKDSDLKEVGRSPKISGSLFVARKGLGEKTVADLSTLLVEKGNADYLLSQKFCEGDCLITDEDAWGVAPAKDADYDGVREVCRTTKSEACEG